MKTDNSIIQAPAACDVGPDDLAAVSHSLKLQTILVPIDFSDCSKAALRYAVGLAEQFGAKIIFLHVLPPAYADAWASKMEYNPFLEGDGREYMQAKLAVLVRTSVPGVIPTAVETRCGTASIEITTAAREHNVDLIVMSTHGHTGRVHAFLGSVAADVTRLAPCAVLVARSREKNFEHKQANGSPQ